MAEGGGAPVAKPTVPVDNNKLLGELKIKLMHFKRGMLMLKQELRNRSELWEAALDEIEMLEGMASEAKEQMKKQRDEMKKEKKGRGKQDEKTKETKTTKDEKQDDEADDKEGAEDQVKNDI